MFLFYIMNKYLKSRMEKIQNMLYVKLRQKYQREINI